MPASRKISTARAPANARPGGLRVEPALAALLRRCGRRVLVHPAAGAVAIDDGAGQVADPAQTRRGGDRGGVARQHGVGMGRPCRASGGTVESRWVAGDAGAAASKGTVQGRAGLPRGAGDGESRVARRARHGGAAIAQAEDQQWAVERIVAVILCRPPWRVSGCGRAVARVRPIGPHQPGGVHLFLIQEFVRDEACILLARSCGTVVRGRDDATPAPARQRDHQFVQQPRRDPLPTKPWHDAHIANKAEPLPIRRSGKVVVPLDPASREAGETSLLLCHQHGAVASALPSIHWRQASAICAPGRRVACRRRSEASNSTIARRRSDRSDQMAGRTRAMWSCHDSATAAICPRSRGRVRSPLHGSSPCRSPRPCILHPSGRYDTVRRPCSGGAGE